jgi:hypothetical protein
VYFSSFTDAIAAGAMTDVIKVAQRVFVRTLSIEVDYVGNE